MGYCVVERQAVELCAIDVLIIHRAKHINILVLLGLNFDLDIGTIQARRSGHVEALLGLNEIVVVYLGEITLVFIF